jgi:hypothetical protein
MTSDSPIKPTRPKLPASLDFAGIQIRSSAKLFSSEPDYDPGLLRVSASISISDFPYDDLLADQTPPIASMGSASP